VNTCDDNHIIKGVVKYFYTFGHWQLLLMNIKMTTILTINIRHSPYQASEHQPQVILEGEVPVPVGTSDAESSVAIQRHEFLRLTWQKYKSNIYSKIHDTIL